MQSWYKNILCLFARFSLSFLVFVSAANAADSVVIDQVGENSIPVQQPKESTLVDTHLTPLGAASTNQNTPLGSPPATNAADYQKAILDNPYTSPQARASVLSTQPNESASSGADKIITSEEKKKHKIHHHPKNNDKGLAIEQTGGNNIITESAGTQIAPSGNTQKAQ